MAQGFRTLPFIEIRTTLNSAQSYAPHFHDCFSIGLILDGKTDFICDGRIYAAQSGDIALIEAGLAHSCNPTGGAPRSYHMLHVNPALWGGAVLRPQNRLVRDAALFQSLNSAIEQDEAMLDQAIRRLMQTHCVAARPIHPPEPIRRAMGMISNASERLEIAQLAKRVGLGREGFIRAFRRNLGLTPGSYQHCARLLKAQRLLRQGVGVAETALLLGYADQSHFHRTFMKYFAATPGQYQKNQSLSYKK